MSYIVIATHSPVQGASPLVIPVLTTSDAKLAYNTAQEVEELGYLFEMNSGSVVICQVTRNHVYKANEVLQEVYSRWRYNGKWVQTWGTDASKKAGEAFKTEIFPPPKEAAPAAKPGTENSAPAPA
jgi:hypothetical protein